MERPKIVIDEHLTYLDNLRESGITNMYGAAAYVESQFGVNGNDAKTILSYWMKSFSERH